MIPFIATLFLWLGISSAAYAQEAALFDHQSPSAPFLAVSDIHFNPFSNCDKTASSCPLINELNKADYTQWENILTKYGSQKISNYGEDTNYALLQSALKEIQNQVKEYRPKFIIIPGDFLAHQSQKNYEFYTGDHSLRGYENFVKKTYQFLTQQLQKYAGNTPIYPVIGNNDSYDGDYAVDPNGTFFADLKPIWTSLLKNRDNETAFKNTFSAGGYYEVTAPGEIHHKIIVLNSLLFSDKAVGANLSIAAQKQLSWLNAKLHEAELKQQKVWLIFHVPVGIDVYQTARTPFHPIKSFWLPQYTQAFQEIVDNYPNEIEAIITAHTHMDGFSLINRHADKLAEIFVPSISPINKTNPAFKVFSYNPRSFKMQNFAVYHLPLKDAQPVWQLEYIFNEVYQPGCIKCSLSEGMQAIQAEGNLAEAYQRYFEAGSSYRQPINEGKWLPYYWCGIGNILIPEYKECVK